MTAREEIQEAVVQLSACSNVTLEQLKDRLSDLNLREYRIYGSASSDDCNARSAVIRILDALVMMGGKRHE